MKILALILAPLGDTLFTTPALKALKNAYPEAVLHVISWEENKDILTGNANIDRLFICRGKGQLLAELQNLRETVYDLAIGLSNIGSFLTYLVNAHRKIGFKGKELGWIYDYNAPDKREIHAVDYCLELAKTVGGIPDPKPVLDLPYNNSDVQKMLEKARRQGVDFNRPLVAIHPGGKYFSFKRWPEKKFSQLAQVLNREYGLQVILLGGQDDWELAEKIIADVYPLASRPINLAGSLKLKETAALLKRVKLFIGNDSAPLHLASAVQTPVIALFGPTAPNNFHPYGTDYELLSAGLACSPCFTWLGELKQYLPEYLPEWASKCKAQCMAEIEVADVLAGMERLKSRGTLQLDEGMADGKLITGGKL